MLPASLQAVPAYADDTTATVPADRSVVVEAWQAGGPQVRAMAEVALTGSDDQVRLFLTTGMEQAAGIDQREAVASAVTDSGPSVRAAAGAALAAYDAGNSEALSAFLSTGRIAPQDIDLRLRVNQLMATGGPQVREAAQIALDSEDPAVLQEFVDSGWQSQWQTDLRLQVNQAMAVGGRQVQAAAQKALDADTPAAYDQFLSYDWDVAAAHDDETTNLEGLLALATEAAATVDRETQNAKDEANRAADAAAAAKRSADEAADAAKKAKNDAAQAKAHAERAARAAGQAAAAARAALGAAAGAHRAAQTAIKAANRAYWAAGKAASAASDAYHSANQALIDRANVGAAKTASDNALAIAKATSDLAEKSNQAAVTLQLLQSAIINSDSATYNMQAAGDASDEALKYAGLTGAAKQKAQAAAAKARAEAERARKALAAAKKYMQVAIDNALKARDAARDAAAEARKAAKAAQDAVNFAGTAADAAVKATDYADAAVTAANKVVDLGTQALAVYNAARDADTERLAVAKDEALEAARDLNTEYETIKKQAAWDADQATKRDAETNQLIALARDPNTDPATAVTAARKAALAVAQNPGAWSQQAALDALSAADDFEVLAFVRTQLDAATAQDNRAAVSQLAASENTALAQAAITALNGTDAQVAQFLKTQNYTGRFTQDRLAVNQILKDANTGGRTITAQRAQAALDADTPQALREFLDTGQYAASATDDRLQVNQLIANPDTGPEAAAAAQVALEGPPDLLSQFLKTGQYQAAERDNANTVHLATVADLMEQINQLGATAVQHAQEAQSAAANARGDATKAGEYANQAIKSAEKATTYANNAAGWANKAANSAKNAIKSANTAQKAATEANKSARTALRSAAWADALHQQAKGYARQAHNYYKIAAKAAKDAGKDVEAIQNAADAAKQEWVNGVATEAAKCYAKNGNALSVNFDKLITGGSIADNCLKNAIADPDELAQRAFGNAGICENTHPQGDQNPDFKDCLNSVLDPGFGYMSILKFTASVTLGFTAMLVPALVVGGVGCLILEPCGAVLGTLLTITDIGSTVYGLIKGDITFSEALKKLGINIIENLAFAGAVKLVSTTYRGLKAVYQANKVAKLGEFKLASTALQQLRLQVSRCKIASKNSFAPNTKVLLAGGGSEAIADVRIGELVLATDPQTGRTAAKPVLGRHANTDHELTDLTVKAARGQRVTLLTTPHHLIWSQSDNRWMAAGALTVGSRLRTPTGDQASIVAVRQYSGTQRMYNLTVADTHTFYVLAGAVPVLVHNTDCFGLTDLGENFWRTPGGLDYGPENSRNFEHRLFHVLAHTVADPSKDQHSVFDLKNAIDVFKVVDEGWALRATRTVKTVVNGDRTTYYIDMGRRIGTRPGQNYLRISVEFGNEVITAFPDVRPPNV